MTYKFKLNQVREVLGMEVKLEAITLLDGTIIEVEKLEPGFEVAVVAADGSKTTAPAGEWTLEDGRIIETDENGIISEISTAEEDVTPEETTVEVSGAAEFAEEPVSEPAVEDAAPAEDVSVAMKALHEKMQLAFEAISEVANEVAAVKEQCNAMQTKMEKFSKLPAGEKIPKVSIPSVEDAIDPIEVKLAAIKNAMKK